MSESDVRRAGDSWTRPWLVIAAVTVLGSLTALYGEVWLAGPSEYTPVERCEPNAEPLMLMDHRYVTWVVARNARAMLTAPTRLFDAEACFPAERSLALGEPALTLGLLGALPYVLTGDPEFTYNAALTLLVIAGMVAAMLLVHEWTGSMPAAVVAALFYEFGRARMSDVLHPYVGDVAWGVFALYFVTRLFESARWRDAFGLAVSLALQLGASAYSQLAVLLVGAPVGLWMVARTGWRRTPWPQLAVVLLAVGLAGWFTTSPYRALRESGALTQRSEAVFAFPLYSFIALSANQPLFGGLPRLLLSFAALWLPAESEGGSRFAPPRWVLIIGGLLSLGAAMGPLLPRLLGLPDVLNLWQLFVSAVPALGAVRVPAAVILGTDLVLILLIGTGVARALQWGRRNGHARAVAVVVSLLTASAVVSCWATFRYRPFRLQPDADDVRFFDDLAARGDSGPMFEWPGHVFEGLTSQRMTLALYHHRQTSMCLASFRSPAAETLRAASEGLPARDGLATLAKMGFSTLIVHFSDAERDRVLESFAVDTQGEPALREIHRGAHMAAYSLAAFAGDPK